ncbi:ATP-dependent nuclease [Actinoplanes sp. NPDC004185]
MISRVEFLRYRGFRKFQVEFASGAVLVGANSAGKSTIAEALALADKCTRIAQRKTPNMRVVDGGMSVNAYAFQASDSDTDPVHHEFSRESARATVVWSSGARLHMVWPEGDDYGMQQGFFWLEQADGGQPKATAVAKLFSPITIIPVLTPLDQVEDLKNAKYINSMVSTRLASRHFRNHLYLMKQNGGLQEFIDFAEPWLPEIFLSEVILDTSADRLGVFYGERASRIPKELAWAGDGVQIWLQLVWHIYRTKGSPTIVLDEPEVYLHPDLQRRLVRLLDDCDAQIILATHSSEVITESPPSSVVWIDRGKRTGKRVTAPSKLAGVADGLGTNYNLALVRATRSKMVIAAEADDVRIIRTLARSVGARSIWAEDNVSLIPIRSFSDWAGSAPLVWMAKDVLTDVETFACILNSDCRPPAFNNKVAAELSAAGVYAKVSPWRELLNCLLQGPILSRASGADVDVMAYRLADAVNDVFPEGNERIQAHRVKFGDGNSDESEGLSIAGGRTADMLMDRLAIVSPALVLARLNEWLVPAGYKELTPLSIARATDASDLPAELIETLLDLEGAVSPPTESLHVR